MPPGPLRLAMLVVTRDLRLATRHWDQVLQPLRAWVLSFGPEVQVMTPEALARDVFEAADATRRRYLRPLRSELRFEPAKPL